MSQNIAQSYLTFPLCSMAKNENSEMPEINSKLWEAQGTHCQHLQLLGNSLEATKGD